MKRISLLALAVLVFCALNVPSAVAHPEFAKAFKAKYTDKDKEPEYTKLVRKAGCFACHVKGTKDKKLKNEYGKALDELVEGSVADRKSAAKEAGEDAQKELKEALKAEIEVALTKVAEVKNEEGVTFGELIKAKKLPSPIVEIEEEEGDDDGDDVDGDDDDDE